MGAFGCDVDPAGAPVCNFGWSLGATAPGAALAFYDDHMPSFPHVSLDADCDCACATRTAARVVSTWTCTTPVALVPLPAGTTQRQGGHRGGAPPDVVRRHSQLRRRKQQQQRGDGGVAYTISM